MDPLTILLTALSAGASMAGETVFKESVKKAYDRLLSLVTKKLEKDKDAEFVLKGFLERPEVYKEPIAAFLKEYSLVQNNELQELAREIVQAIGRDPSKAFLEYLSFTARECQYISLQGLDIKSSDPHEDKKYIELSKVYVDLNTTTTKRKKERQEKLLAPDEEKTELLSVKEAVAREPYLLLLGDPGSGKSTFLNYLSYGLAINGLKSGNDPYFADWPATLRYLTPIKIILRDFARQMNHGDKPDKARCLLDFIVRMLKDNALEDAEDRLKDVLENAAFVLLDGLDEIGDVHKREAVQQAIAAFKTRYPKSRYIVTCRIRSYEQYGWNVPGFKTFELAPFDEKQIIRFIETWYNELEQQEQIPRGKAETLQKRLKEAINRPDIKELAPNPLLLTVMTLVHAHKGELPDARVLLYKEAVEILMYRWDSIKVRGESDNPTLLQLLQQAERDKVDVETVCCRLAFDAKCGQIGQKQELADLSAYDLEYSLADLKLTESGKPDKNWAQDIVETLKLRAGLLIERTPGIFTFPHRTFQEYLAAVHLASQPDYVSQTYRLTENISYWREVILLSVGVKVYIYKQFSDVLTLVAELVDDKNKTDEHGWRRIALAGDILKEMKVKRASDTSIGRKLLATTKELHVELVRHNKLPARERAAAGVNLSHLGDPRDTIMSVEHMSFCWVPGCDCWLGDGDSIHLNKELQDDFWVAQFPVSNAQFNQFIGAQGYMNKNYWAEACGAGYWKDGRFKGRHDNEWRTSPLDLRSWHNLANHPVVGVTWYEALAYCRWMDELFCGKLNGWRIQMISEAEWEKAARGGLVIPETPVIKSLNSWPFEHSHSVMTNPKPQRNYPWTTGNMTENANYRKTYIYGTSALGCFSAGCSPVGAEEMSGNVREWTRNTCMNNPYRDDGFEKELESLNKGRGLRGGCCFDDAPSLRCADRSWFDECFLVEGFGFRVVLSPH